MKNKSLIILAVVLTTILAFSFTAAAKTTATVPQFTDVKDTDWYAEPIYALSSWDIMVGTSANTFSPKKELTRAEFVKVLANILDEDLSDYEDGDAFSDVPKGKWYTAPINWAEDAGIVNGKTPGKFDPFAPITRQELTTMLLRFDGWFFEGLLDIDDDVIIPLFKDNKQIAPWAKEGVDYFVAFEVINGYPDGTFKPKATIKRGETAQVVFNYLTSELFSDENSQ
ncbi:MAG: S-layer homology domain-containing protein [Bacillota bacterium]|jgi:hypothetical protein